MAQINDSVRQNLVNSTYLHSNKFNFYNAALGGPNYVQMLEHFQDSRVLKNLKDIESRLMNIIKKLQIQERAFYDATECSGPKEFTDKFLRPGDTHKQMIKDKLSVRGESIEYYSNIIMQEIGFRIVNDRAFCQYILGYELNEVVNIMKRNLENSSAVNFENNIKWKKAFNEFERQVLKDGISTALLHELQQKAGSGEILKISMKTENFTPRGGKGTNKNVQDIINGYAQDSLVRGMNALISQAALNAKNELNDITKQSKNRLFTKIDNIAKELINKYELLQYQDKILSQIKKLSINKIIYVFKEAKKEIIEQAQLETDRKKATGDALEIGMTFILNNLQLNNKSWFTPTGTKQATKEFANSTPQKKGQRSTLSQDKEGHPIEYYLTEKGKSEIRQDGIMNIRSKGHGKIQRWGFQMKNSYEKTPTIHMQSEIDLDTLLMTMEYNQMLSEEQHKELLYMLSNYYYFKNNPDDSSSKKTGTIAKTKDSTGGNYTVSSSASLRYISILLQAGLEMILEPAVSNYTKKRMERINSETNSGIVGNNFYIIHNILVPVSYFFISLKYLIDDYILFLKEQTPSKYFTVNEPDIKDFNMISAVEMRKDKDENLIKIRKNETEGFNQWLYPEPLLGTGSRYGKTFIDGAKLTGYNIFVKLDDLDKQIANMDINL